MSGAGNDTHRCIWSAHSFHEPFHRTPAWVDELPSPSVAGRPRGPTHKRWRENARRPAAMDGQSAGIGWMAQIAPIWDGGTAAWSSEGAHSCLR